MRSRIVLLGVSRNGGAIICTQGRGPPRHTRPAGSEDSRHVGPLHGFGIARRSGQAPEDALLLDQGTLYPALVRLERRGWIRSKWGVSDNNRRARFYSLTKAGPHTSLSKPKAGSAWPRSSRECSAARRGLRSYELAASDCVSCPSISWNAPEDRCSKRNANCTSPCSLSKTSAWPCRHRPLVGRQALARSCRPMEPRSSRICRPLKRSSGHW